MNDSYSEKILEFKNVSTGYQDRSVLKDISFSILKGEFVYMIGRTGAGKSSLLKMIYADLLPDKGGLTVGDYDITKLKNKEIPFLRRKIGIVFQDFQLLPDRDIYENNKINNKINELMARVGLSDKLHSRPHQLSGGEQQRVSIARALINDPILLLADEPTGNLDPEATDMIMEILFRINLAGTSVIMATHEHDLIRRYPARTLECKNGGVIDHKMNFQ
jgi:cell division transport system ATP-binding protein